MYGKLRILIELLGTLGELNRPEFHRHLSISHFNDD